MNALINANGVTVKELRDWLDEYLKRPVDYFDDEEPTVWVVHEDDTSNDVTVVWPSITGCVFLSIKKPD
jgi:hypothetical protein